MKQSERMNSAYNLWEPHPWDTTNEVADKQLQEFQRISAIPVAWTALKEHNFDGALLFDFNREKLTDLDVEYYATVENEQFLLMHLIWHDFPDPPPWRLAFRRRTSSDIKAIWQECGYFDQLPAVWSFNDSSPDKIR